MKKFLMTIFITLLILIPFSNYDVQAVQLNEKTKPTIENNFSSPENKTATIYSENSSGVRILNKSKHNYKASNSGLEQKILTSLRNYETKIDVSYYTLDFDYAFDIFSKVLDDNPEITFYIGTTLRGESYPSRLYIKVEYLYDKNTRDTMSYNLDNKVNSIIASIIKDNMSDIEKELVIHNYIVKNCKYDTSNKLPHLSYTCYGTLINNLSVCQGYAEAMKLLLNKVNIDCKIVSSESMNHAWNCVKIGGYYYQLDATWDDPIPNDENFISLKYFNLSNLEMAEKDHEWSTYDYPDCYNIKYNFMSNLGINGLNLYNSNLIYSDTTGTYKLNINTLKKEKIQDTYFNSIVVAKNFAFVTDNARGNIFKLDLTTNSIVKILDGSNKVIYIKNGNLYYENDNNELCNLKLDIKNLDTNCIGWVLENNNWYYYDNYGLRKLGWLLDNNHWYYLNQQGTMYTDWKLIGKYWYHFSDKGVMSTNWNKIDNLWYYFTSNGDMVTGWKQINGKWYYFYGNGSMASNTTIGGYKLGSDGAWY